MPEDVHVINSCIIIIIIICGDSKSLEHPSDARNRRDVTSTSLLVRSHLPASKEHNFLWKLLSVIRLLRETCVVLTTGRSSAGQLGKCTGGMLRVITARLADGTDSHRARTTGSDVAEERRDALCQSTCCHLLHNCSRSCIRKRLAKVNDLEGSSRSSQMEQFERPRITSY